MFAYLVCHLVGVSSSCSNPILYGLLNYNFHHEFVILVRKIKEIFEFCGTPCKKHTNSQHSIENNGQTENLYLNNLNLWMSYYTFLRNKLLKQYEEKKSKKQIQPTKINPISKWLSITPKFWEFFLCISIIFRVIFGI